MEFTYEELREEEKKNIDIIESCEKIKEEIDENIKNINSIINNIQKQGEIDKQIEEINEQMKAFNKDNSNEKANEILSMRKERLSELKTLLILNRDKNESDIEMLEREIKKFEQQKSEIDAERKKAVRIMENIVEICKEHIEELDKERNLQSDKSKKIGDITEQYAKLEEELEGFKAFDGFLTKKQQKRIIEIEKEKEALESQMIDGFPDLKQTIINKTKTSQLDLLFAVTQIQEGKALDRKTTIINSYKKVAEEISKYITDKAKESDKNNKKNSESEEKRQDNKEIKNEKTNESSNIKEEQSKEGMQEDHTKDSYAVSPDWEIIKQNEKLEQLRIQKNTEDMEKANPKLKEVKVDVIPLNSTTNEKNNNADSDKNKNDKAYTQEIDKEESEIKPDVTFKSEFREFASALGEKTNPLLEQDDTNQTTIELGDDILDELKKEFSNPYEEALRDFRINGNNNSEEEYINELRKDAKKLKIDKKIKRKVEKEKKRGRIKRFFQNIKNRLFEPDELEIAQDTTTEKIQEKSGRTK